MCPSGLAGQTLVESWMAGSLTLGQRVAQPGGGFHVVVVPPQPVVPPPSDEDLARIPGAAVAYKGFQGLTLKATYFAGGKILVRPERVKASGA